MHKYKCGQLKSAVNNRNKEVTMNKPNQSNQPEYKGKLMQDFQDEKKSAQSKDKSSGSGATGKLKSKQGQSMSSGAKDEGCCS